MGTVLSQRSEPPKSDDTAPGEPQSSETADQDTDVLGDGQATDPVLDASGDIDLDLDDADQADVTTEPDDSSEEESVLELELEDELESESEVEDFDDEDLEDADELDEDGDEEVAAALEPATEASDSISSVVALARASTQDPELAVRRSRLMRKNRELRTQKTRLAIVFAAVAGSLTVGLAFTTIRTLNGLDREDQLASQLEHARLETRQVEAALSESRQQISELVRNRIPGVRPVEYDSVISIGEHSVRNVMFTVTRTQRVVSYEVHAVVENATTRTIEPQVDLVLLGSLGLELGRVGIGESEEGEKPPGAMLPGEVRSYTASVSIDRGEEPAFFLLQGQ